MPWNRYKPVFVFVIIFLLSCGASVNIPDGWKKYKIGDIKVHAPPGFVKDLTSNQLVNGQQRIEVNEGTYNLPTSLEDSFMKAFNAYHFNKFFDQVLMDPKVKKMFRDSVTLVNIYILDADSPIHCDNCNVMAQLKFKSKVFDFPVQMSEKEVNDHQCFMRFNQSTDQFQKQTFIATNQCGVSKTFITNGSSSYTVTYSGLYADELAIAQSIRF